MNTISKILDTLSQRAILWFESAVEMLPNFVVAIVIILVFMGIARIMANITQRSLARLHKRQRLQHLLSTIVKWTVVFVGIFIALGILNLDKTVTSLLAGAGVLGLALGFAFQDIASNLMSGILLSFQSPFKNNHIIELEDGTIGKVLRSNVRSTELETFEGQIVTIPNKTILQNKLTNYSQKGTRRIDVEVGVSYDTNLDEAEKNVKETLSTMKSLASDKIEVFYNTFGGSSINFTARFWINFEKQPDFLEARSDAIKRIQKSFSENDINIPFPIRTVYMHNES
jgi:small conductance mechanosensitive channel